MPDWLSITLYSKDPGTVWFCHIGCLFHWIVANEPRYLAEVCLEP